MSENLFWPDVSVVIYAVVSALFCLIVYRAKLSLFAWDSPKMQQRMGNGWIRSVDAYDGPAQAAGTVATNVMNTMTPGAGASLLVLAAWVLSLLAGATLVPALFGAMPRATTLNVLLVGVASLFFAFAMSRLTVTLIQLAFGLAIVLVFIGLIAAGALYLINFLAGGRLPIDAISSQTRGQWERLIDAAGLGNGGPYEQRVEFNSCAMSIALSSTGDMKLTRERCDRDWSKQQQSLNQERALADARESESIRKGKIEIDAWLKRHGYDEAVVFQPGSRSLGTGWKGGLVCQEKRYFIALLTHGDEQRAKGVMHVFTSSTQSPYSEGMTKTASSYRVELSKTDGKVELSVMEPLLAAQPSPAIAGSFEHIHGVMVSLKALDTQPKCAGTLDATMDRAAVERKLAPLAAALSGKALNHSSNDQQLGNEIINDAREIKNLWLSAGGKASFPRPDPALGPATGNRDFPFGWQVHDRGGRYLALYDVHESVVRAFNRAIHGKDVVFPFGGANAFDDRRPYGGYAEDSKYWIVVPFAWLER